jgi:hypothetical protein
MRRFAAATTTAFLSAAAFSAGAAATAQAATPGPTVHAAVIHASTIHASRIHASTIRLLGSLRLRRVDTMTGQNQVTLLLCTATTTDDNPPVIRGLGGIKHPTAACAELAAVHGDFDKLAVHPAWMAPALEAPVEVRASGTWEGSRVQWSHRYANSGWLTKTTGEVFEF